MNVTTSVHAGLPGYEAELTKKRHALPELGPFLRAPEMSLRIGRQGSAGEKQPRNDGVSSPRAWSRNWRGRMEGGRVQAGLWRHPTPLAGPTRPPQPPLSHSPLSVVRARGLWNLGALGIRPSPARFGARSSVPRPDFQGQTSRTGGGSAE